MDDWCSKLYHFWLWGCLCTKSQPVYFYKRAHSQKAPEMSQQQARLPLPWTAQSGQTLLISIVCCGASCPLRAAVSAHISCEWHRSEQASGDQVVPLTPWISLTEPPRNKRRSTVEKTEKRRRRLFIQPTDSRYPKNKFKYIIWFKRGNSEFLTGGRFERG